VNRRTRAKLCIWLILIGLINFLAYTVAYAYIKGDATNGKIENGRYYVGGHFIHFAEGRMQEVSRGVWIYSYAHSISIWPTIAMVLLALLALARPLIIAAYGDSRVSGATLVGVIATQIVVVMGLFTAFFTIDFIRNLIQHH